jgi:hypothetical protein
LDIGKVIVLNLQVAVILDLKIYFSNEAHLSVAQTNFYCPGPITRTHAICHRVGHQAMTALTALSAAELATLDSHRPTCTAPPLALSLHEAKWSSPHFHFPLPTLPLCSTLLHLPLGSPSSATTVHLSRRPSHVIAA